LRVDAVKLGGLDQRCEAGPVDGTVVVAVWTRRARPVGRSHLLCALRSSVKAS